VSSPKEPPPPLEANDMLVTAALTAAWAVALIVLLAVQLAGGLPARERWWIWTCVAGLGLGLFGMWYVPRLKRDRTRAAAQQTGLRRTAQRDSGSKTVSSTETPGNSTRS
jgi:hypothetical protein